MSVRSKSQKVKKSKGGRHQLSVISKEASLQWEELNVIGACRHNDYTLGMPRSADNLLRNDNREYAIKKYLNALPILSVVIARIPQPREPWQSRDMSVTG